MTKFVLLRIENDDEALDLLGDMAEYPDDPLLTPVQENTVHATVAEVNGLTFTGGTP
jgi:hypothetical protein